MSQRNSTIPASYLILERDEKILLMKRFQTGYMDGFYSLPAGHVDPGELPMETMVREAKEEVGIDVTKQDLVFVHVDYEVRETEEDRVDFYFKSSRWSGEPIIIEPHKCDEMRWVSVNDLPENVIPKVRVALEAYKNQIPYAEK